MEFIGVLWNELLMRPMINSLALLADVLFDNFGLSIIVFTILIRIVLIPLTVRQTRSMKKMQELQPRLKSLQERYKDKGPAEKRKLSSETMKLYKEAGVNPIGCLGPLVIQMPIWFGLYRSILRTMPPTPEGLANLSASFYSWNPAISNVPINSKFLGIDLVDFVQGAPLPWNYALPVLVGVTMFLQQKMTMGNQVATSPQQAQTNQIMLWMLPIMFGFFTFQFPAGLAVYILFSNIVGVIIQYYVGGKQPVVLFGRAFLGSAEAREKSLAGASASAAPAAALVEESELEENDEDGQSENVHRQDRRRGNRKRSGNARRRSRRR
ncbi:MAG: YidC/Oxa1 family membrane protein insertase [Chloroflexi bacterium]|nr:YidC/Oxa1 family membrane protein insertase [Chloroflexota bacterium]MDA1296746.1 YidC/Oxa1 family membrane protein insertase [Chloroflexota bacterium]